jgi:hypothetical protein
VSQLFPLASNAAQKRTSRGDAGTALDLAAAIEKAPAEKAGLRVALSTRGRTVFGLARGKAVLGAPQIFLGVKS